MIAYLRPCKTASFFAKQLYYFRRNRKYPNCAAARAAGAAPLYRGQPGYGRHLDRDNDGKACE
ncbi:MAG: excalibur calcium-binding domain-containing protein [Sphingomonadales bacterium]|nr:excalibur calcium-binding domain-containing protein [Sphingomonadales bacterium]NCQ20694.1 excalibur calcium-binding domain-containing protein [Sphingomonadales bacterium]NCT04829.1 excalibur calcium-binding domain-containing protein [Sphingomonadales bacterium]